MEPHWTAYVTAFATPVVAGLGLWIARRQWVTARDKLRLDLFEKRMLIYDAFRKAESRVLSSAGLSTEHKTQYLIDVSSAKWLFGEEVVFFLEDEFPEKLDELRLCSTALMRPQLSDEERWKFTQQEIELLRWFGAQRTLADQLFMPYLSFREIAT